MSEEIIYSQHGLRYMKPLRVRSHRCQLDNEVLIGLNRDESKRYTDEIQYELASCLATLLAVFNKDHPEHHEYTDLELKLNHVSLWGKIEDDLRCLIDDVIEFNRPEPEEYEDE